MIIALTARLGRISRKDAKPIIRYVATSRTSTSKKNNDIFETITSYNPKKKKFQEIKKRQNNRAEHLFKLLTKNDKEQKAEAPAESEVNVPENQVVQDTAKTTEEVELKTSDAEEPKAEKLSVRMMDIMKEAEISVSDEEGVELTHPKKSMAPRKRAQDDLVLKRAREVALELGIDVEQTQNELAQAFQAIRAEAVDDYLKVTTRKQREHHTYEDTATRQIFGTSRLHIFEKKIPEAETSKLEIWNELNRITLLNKTNTSPKNYFDELINWTCQGKLWHFPIDNEQGMDDEKRVDFSDHVFLDQHLEPWCPKAGPLRHFMELVCVGLSKNPYISAAKKKEHIMWYKDYIESKKKLVTELGLMETPEIAEEEKKIS